MHTLSIDDLMRVPKNDLITALWKKQYAAEPLKVRRPNDTLQRLQPYVNKTQEHFIVLSLNGAHEIIRIRVVTKGLVNRTVVHPREVFRGAIKDNSTAIIVAHNHPSASTKPSEDDRDVTKRLAQAGAIIGITVLDHIIFGKAGYYSFLEHGEL